MPGELLDLWGDRENGIDAPDFEEDFVSERASGIDALRDLTRI